MNNKKTLNLSTIVFLCITTAFLITCKAALAQSQGITKDSSLDSNIQKITPLKNIDPNAAAKVIKAIINLDLFQLSKETVIVPDTEKKWITVRAINSEQMDLIEEIVKNIDFPVKNEGTINIIYIKLENLVFGQVQSIITPLLSEQGKLSYNITAHTLKVTDIDENLNYIDNFIKKLDSYEIDDPKVVVQFTGMRIEKICSLLNQWTGKEVIPSEEARNLTVTVFAPERMKRSEAIDLLYNAIRQQGYSVEETDDTIYIKAHPQKPGTTQLIEPNEPLENIKDEDEVVRKIYKLKFTKPSIMGQLILPHLSSAGHFSADDNTKTLTVSDKVKSLIKIDKLINIYDSDPNSRPKGGAIYPVNPGDPNEGASSQNLSFPQQANSNSLSLYQSASQIPVKNVNTGNKNQTTAIKKKSKLVTYLDRIIKVLDSMTIKSDDPRIDVNFTNAGINQIIEALIRWTGKAVLPSNEALNLKITLSSPKKIRQSEALNLLYTEIRKQGLIIEKRNNILHIKPVSATGTPYHHILDPNDSLDDIEDQDMVARIIFKLKYNSPANIREILLPLLSPSANITADETTKSLYIIDTVKKLKQYKEIIKQLDSDISQRTSVLYGFSVQDSNEIVKIINQILKQQADSNSSSLPPITGRTGRTTRTQVDANSTETNINKSETQRQDYDAILVRFINSDLAAKKLNDILSEMEIDTKNRLVILPLSTSNQVLVFGNNQEDRELAKSLINDIDFQAAENSYDFEKVPLEHFNTVLFTDLASKVIKEAGSIRLSLYPNVSSKQILVFGAQEYRDVIRNFAEKIDIQSSLVNAEDSNSLNNAADNFDEKIFEVSNSDSVELTELLKVIIKNIIDKNVSSNINGETITLIPVPDINSIIIKAPDEAMDIIVEWITKLDSAYDDKIKNISLSEIEDSNQVVMKIYRLENNSLSQISQKIKPLLSNIGYLSTEDNAGVILIRDKVSVILQIEQIITDFELTGNKESGSLLSDGLST